jgi:group II intron reverse transcriptase/maturase
MKSFGISKMVVWEAWKQVRANRGAAGVDSESIEMYEEKLEDNLYKLWNRMSSGSYFPPRVRLVDIPKPDGGKRRLGIPTVADRIAQTVVKKALEPNLETVFHDESYGYRPGKSALEAVGKARQRCWKLDWVIDLDIEGFFDNIDHELMMRLVEKHTHEKWVKLYIDRWLKAPGEDAEGREVKREKGTPQGGVISPLLANLFLHYAFDDWMRNEFPTVPFERYADDLIVHCSTEKQAKYILERIRNRFGEWKLALHAEKTQIVYCKDGRRKGGEGRSTRFDFLGYTFRRRSVKSRGGNLFTGFTPAVSDKAKKRMRYAIRSWRLTCMTMLPIREIAARINPIIRGWIIYYGAYNRSALATVFDQVDLALAQWAKRKFKNLRRGWVRALRWLAAVSKREPTLFAHWNGKFRAIGQ